ncbi:MAG TPA: LysM peptidoglycan-binding domain-containing protein [Burkholderiales bacterium]
MGRTISKNDLLTFFLGFALPAIVAGCSSVPSAPEAHKSEAPLPAADIVATRVVAPATATAPAEAETSVFESALPESLDTASVVVQESRTVEEQLEETLAPDDEAVADAADAVQEHANIWDRLRAGFRLPPLDSPLVERHERWFVENVEFREAMFERARMYLYFIAEEVSKRGMPMEIALLPAIESAYKPYAYSRARASGLWQFIPSTGRLYGLKSDWWYDGRRDIVASTRAALDYLEKLHRDFDGDWHLAIAAYNAGEGRVMRAIEWNRRRGLPTDFASLRQLKPETKNYVPKLMAIANIVADPARYGIRLPDIPNEPYFAKVELDSQVDLGLIARLTGLDVDQLHFINPGYRRFATAPDGPHHVLVPVDKRDAVIAGISSIPEEERVQWLHHTVRRGDTLYEIARRYKIDVSAIKTANRLRGNMLRVGQTLMLPIPATAARVAAASSARSAKPVRTAAQVNRPVIHRVRRGETLTSIARRYNVLAQQIAEWNKMKVDDVLHIGRRLKIWLNDGPRAFHRAPDALAYA